MVAATSRPLAGLRVAYLAFDPFPNRKGSGTRMAELTRGLSHAGAEVTLLTLPGTSDDAPPPGVTLAPIRVAEDNYLCRVQAFSRAAARALWALRPDVVHFRGPFEGRAALQVARALGARVVFEVNGLPSVELGYHYRSVGGTGPFVLALRRLEREVLAGADAIITQSQATQRFLRLRGVDANAVDVIPNGATLLPEPPARENGGPLRLLYAGTLAPWQGLGDVVQALTRIGREHEVELAVVGWGQKRWRRGLERRARGGRLRAARVRFEPALDRSALAARIADSDVCLAPLARDRRNRVQGASPIKLFEYMAAARAVLATDLPCLREIVDHGATGLLARPSHPRDLAHQLATLCADATLRRRLGRAARDAVAQHATWDHRRAALVERYLHLAR